VSLPSGQWELSRSLQQAPPVVDRSIGRSCASVSRGRHVSNIPVRVMEELQVLCDTYPLCVPPGDVKPNQLHDA